MNRPAGVDKGGHVHPGQPIRTSSHDVFSQFKQQIPHSRVRGQKGSGVDMSTFVHPGSGPHLTAKEPPMRAIRDLLANYNSGILRARQAYAAHLDELDRAGGRSSGCGTVAGHATHKRHKTEVCDDCQAAMRDYNRDRRANRKAAS